MASQYGNLSDQQTHRPEYSDLGAIVAGIRARHAARKERLMMLEQRADRFSIYFAVFLAGYVTCAEVNHVKDLWSQHGQLQVVQQKVIPQLKAKVNCEHHVALHNESVAKEAIESAIDENAPVPSPTEIQNDPCHANAK